MLECELSEDVEVLHYEQLLLLQVAECTQCDVLERLLELLCCAVYVVLQSGSTGSQYVTIGVTANKCTTSLLCSLKYVPAYGRLYFSLPEHHPLAKYAHFVEYRRPLCFWGWLYCGFRSIGDKCKFLQ